MSIEFTSGRKGLNPNDCWVDALALALDIKYHQAHDKLEEYKYEDGTMNMNVFAGVLQTKGFRIIDIEEERLSVEDVVNYFDSTNNKMVLFTMPERTLDMPKSKVKTGHIVYVKDNKVYDFKDKFFSEYIVVEIYIKKDKVD